MSSMKVKIVVLLVIVGLLSACAAQPSESLASAPTDTAAPAISSPQGTEAPTSLPAATDTSMPVVESSPTAEPAPAGTAVSFATEILPIIQSRCINCHGGDRTEEGLSLKTYTDIMQGSENGAVITPGDAHNSLFAELVANQKMPKRGPKLTPPQVQLIEAWINQGALDN